MVIQDQRWINQKMIRALFSFCLGYGSFVLFGGCTSSPLEPLQCITPTLLEVYSPQTNPQSPPQLDEGVFEDKYWALKAQFCLPWDLNVNIGSPSLELHSAALVFQIEPLPDDQGRILMNFLESPTGQTVNENQALPLASSQWIPVGIYDKSTSLHQIYFDLDLEQEMAELMTNFPEESLKLHSLSFNLEVGTRKQDHFAGDCTLLAHVKESQLHSNQDDDTQTENQYSVPGLCQLIQLKQP